MQRSFIFIFLLSSFCFLLGTTTVFSATISRPMHNTGLIGYWAMEEGKGNSITYDRSGRGNNGTLTNMNSATVWVSSRAGLGTALNFDGASDYVDINTSAVFNTSVITVSAWVNVDTYGTNEAAVSRDSVTGLNRDWALGLGTASNTFRFHTFVSDVQYNAESTTGFSTGVWHHIVGTYDGSNVRLYVDGVNTETTPIVGSLDTDPADVFIGARSQPTSYFDGKVDEVRIYNRALSQEEINRLYNLQKTKVSSGINNTGLVGHWKFDEGFGTRAEDSSVNKNVGTLTGSMTNADWVTGTLGKALDFDGSDDEVQVSSTFGLGSTDVSILTWVYIPSTSQSGAFVKIGNNTTGIGLGVGASNFDTNGNDLMFLFEGVRWIDTGDLIGTGWHHVALTVNSSGKPQGFIDGVSVFSDTGTNATAPSGSATYIGGYTGSGAENRHGQYILDDVRIYNRALPASEIKSIYESSEGAVVLKTNTDRLRNGLVGHWTFDGKNMYQDKVLDLSGNNRSGTLTGGASPTFGKIGQAVEFDGVDDYIGLGDVTVVDGLTALTVSAWVKGTGVWISKWNDSGTNYSLLFSVTSGSVQLAVRGENNTSLYGPGTATIPSNEWTHITAIWPGNNTLVYYVNGVHDPVSSYTSQQDPDSINNSSAPLSFGARYNNGSYGNFFDGAMDEVRIYNRALSAQEAYQLYNMGR